MAETLLTDNELAAIRSRHEATTKGIWSANLEPFNGEGSINCWVIRSTIYAGLSPMLHYPSFMAGGRCAIPEETTQANTEFAAHAHQDVPRLLDEIERLTVEVERMRAALTKIAKWFGEFPETGRTWEGSGEPMSYGAVNGSNGERDFMRQVAREALTPAANVVAVV